MLGLLFVFGRSLHRMHSQRLLSVDRIEEFLGLKIYTLNTDVLPIRRKPES